MRIAEKELPNGRTVYCLNPHEVDYMYHEIYSESYAEKGVELPVDGVYYDVGANVGIFSMFLKETCPGATIYAYEPIPATFAALEKNLIALGDSCRAICKGMGSRSRDAEFDFFPMLSVQSSCRPDVAEAMNAGLRKVLLGDGNAEAIRNIRDAQSGGTLDPEYVDSLFVMEKVRCRIGTLAEEFALHKNPIVDLLKIDTEGSELEVLDGISEEDWPRIRQILVEVHLGRGETRRIEMQLQSRGYATMRDEHPMAKGGAPVFRIFGSSRS